MWSFMTITSIAEHVGKYIKSVISGAKIKAQCPWLILDSPLRSEFVLGKVNRVI